MNIKEEYKKIIQDTIKLLQEQDDNFLYLKNVLPKNQAKPLIKTQTKQTFSTTVKELPKTFASSNIEKPLEKKPVSNSISPKAPQNKPPSYSYNFDNFAEVKLIIQKAFPQLEILEEIMDDKIAYQVAESYKTKNKVKNIVFLYYKINKKQFIFLENIALCLSLSGSVVDAEIIEKENEWNNFFSTPELKYIISYQSVLKDLAKLKSYYKKNPQTKQYFLNKTHLFFIRNPQEYLDDPLLKKELYKDLKSKELVL